MVLFNGYLCIFALIQNSHDEQISSVWDKEMEFKTLLTIEYKSLELGCPSLWCQSRSCCGLIVTNVQKQWNKMA